MFNWFWEFLYGIVKAVLYCIDFVLRFAQMLCGIQPISVDGREIDITNYFLTQDRVLNAFMLVVMIGFILLFIFTAFSVLRSIAKSGEGKSPLRVCVNSAKILLYFLLVPAIMILGASFVSVVMRSLSAATSLTEAQSLGSSMFSIFTDEAFIGEGGVSKEDIMSSFVNGSLDYYDTGVVGQYFRLSQINYFLAFAAGISVLVLLLTSLVSFVERLISLVVLFIIAPISMSSAALDDGVRFKLWRDQVINKFLIAYGALLSLNIFMLLLSLIFRIQFFENDFWNGLARLLFIIGGAVACRRGTTLIGNLVNSGAGTADTMDQAHANGVFSRLGNRLFGTAGMAVGAVAGGAGHVAGAAGRSLGHTIQNSRPYTAAKAGVSHSVHDIRDRFTGKLQTAGMKTKGSAASAQATSNGNDTTLNDILKGTVNQDVSVTEMAAGNDTKADNHDKINDQSAASIVNAMHPKGSGKQEADAPPIAAETAPDQQQGTEGGV